MLLTYKENVHSTQMYIPLKPLFSRHKGIGVQFTDEPTGALDSATGHHIMDLFHKLHREQGKTIVLITHSRELAEETERIITLRDGVIVDDTGKTRAVGHGGKAVDETGKRGGVC